MNSSGKSTACKNNLDPDWSVALARLHCLQALFPDWAGSDPFLLQQLKSSIETSMQDSGESIDSIEKFVEMAVALREASGTSMPVSHGFIRLDYNGRTWDPLFARHEIVKALKKEAGIAHLFLIVKGLPEAVFPGAAYKTKARLKAIQNARNAIDALARQWSTPSTCLHLLYI